MSNKKSPKNYVTLIRRSGISIYDPIETGSDLWIPSPELEKLLNRGLRGLSLEGLPLRTRSKILKQRVCTVLGYPVPESFQKTRPRFPGQCFDTYIQKSNNLQVWNEDLSSSRRYAIIRVSPDDVIEKVRVVTGDTLGLLDTTGTLTQKYQARLVVGSATVELVTPLDTQNLRSILRHGSPPSTFSQSPTDYPTEESVIPISDVFDKLKALVGKRFTNTGYDQERNRGAALHGLVCERLGYKIYRDDGRFPDVRNQLIEVKLQMSPTVDLGLVRPDSEDVLDIPQIKGRQLRHCDVRYAMFYGQTSGSQVTLTHFYATTGEGFFGRFPQFQGKVLNKKLQIRLPGDFFE